MKKKMEIWKKELQNPNKFQQFHNYIFNYLSENKKIICKNY